LSEAAVA